MPEGHLSPQDANEVKLTRLNRAARIRKIREYAGELAAGRENYFGDTQVRTRAHLVILAERRKALDKQLEILAPVSEGLARLYASLEVLCETSELATSIRAGVPNPANQPTLPTTFDNLGDNNGKDF